MNLQEHGLYNFEHPAEESVQLQHELEAVRERIKASVRNKHATWQTAHFTYNNSAAKGKTFVNKMSRMALRSYNAEVENAITRMKAGNLDAAIKRINRAQEQVAKMGDMIDLVITPSYHQLRITELQLASRHLAAKAAAKEAEREERAQLREEKKAQAEMEAERKRLEKERTHYENSIANSVNKTVSMKLKRLRNNSERLTAVLKTSTTVQPTSERATYMSSPTSAASASAWSRLDSLAGSTRWSE